MELFVKILKKLAQFNWKIYIFVDQNSEWIQKIYQIYCIWVNIIKVCELSEFVSWVLIGLIVLSLSWIIQKTQVWLSWYDYEIMSSQLRWGGDEQLGWHDDEKALCWVKGR